MPILATFLKYPNKSILREKRFTWLTVQGYIVHLSKEVIVTQIKEAGLIASKVIEQRMRNGLLSSRVLSHSHRTPAHRMAPSTVRVDLLTSINLSR